MKKITKKMIDEFTKVYLSESPLNIKKTEFNDGCFEIFIEHGYIRSNTLPVLSDNFYNVINKYFNEQDIELSFNNTGTIFWTDN